MRRAIVALVSTAAGTVLLVGAKTGLGQTASPAPAPLSDNKQEPSKSAAGSAPPSAAPVPSASAKAAVPGALRNGTWKGKSIDVDYGNVQLAIVVAGGKITDVKVLEAPQVHERSLQINVAALPKLRQEALAKQSASIDSVSGASYTSDGYRRSLQSAIDQARGA